MDNAARLGMQARVLGIAANFATVPLAIATVTVSQFGVWSAITSMLSVMTFLDLGIGNGAMGQIAQARARDDQQAAVRIIRHAYTVLLSTAVFVILAVGTAYKLGLVASLLNSSGSFLSSYTGLVVAFVMVYALVIPATFVQRLFYAYHLAGHASVMQLVFSLGYLGFVAVCYFLKLGVAALVVGYAGILLTVYGGYTIYFLKKYDLCAGLLGPVDRGTLRSLLRDSGLFFLLQSTVAIVYNSDQLILSSFVSPREVAVYSASMKMFTVVMMMNAVLLSPLWPAFSDAIARKDWSWIRQAYRRNLARATVFSTAICVGLLIAGPIAVRIWTHGKIETTIPLLFLLAIWVMLEGYGQCMAMLLNAMNVLRLQIAVALTLLVIGTWLKIFFAQKLGMYGPLTGTIISFVAIVAVVETIYIHRLLGKHK